MNNRKHRDVNKQNNLRKSGGKRAETDMESAAELTVPARSTASVENNSEKRQGSIRRATETTESAGRMVGWFALVFAIVSWFMWGVLLGATSVVLGFIAYRQGSRSLGVWSITLGLISILANLILIPLFATFV